jgi:hypothetical protein
MDGLLVFGIILAGLSTLGGLALRLGVDSRIGSQDPKGPAQPVGLD